MIRCRLTSNRLPHLGLPTRPASSPKARASDAHAVAHGLRRTPGQT
jgi:hypothetical protein